MERLILFFMVFPCCTAIFVCWGYWKYGDEVEGYVEEYVPFWDYYPDSIKQMLFHPHVNVGFAPTGDLPYNASNFSVRWTASLAESMQEWADANNVSTKDVYFYVGDEMLDNATTPAALDLGWGKVY